MQLARARWRGRRLPRRSSLENGHIVARVAISARRRLDLVGHNQALGASLQQPLDQPGPDSAGLVFPLLSFEGRNELLQRTSF